MHSTSYLKTFTDWFTCVIFVEISYLNADMCKFESSQKKKAEPSRLIPRKLAANLEVLIGSYSYSEKFNACGFYCH